MNRTDCKKLTPEKVEYHKGTINAIILEIADSAYCYGYNHVLEAAEKVLDESTYKRLIEELAEIN